MQRGIGLDLVQLIDAHTSDFRNASEIVAQQIDDHQILGAVLAAGGKTFARLFIARRIRAARRGALHRPRRQPPIRRQIEEQFRRQAEDVALAVGNESTLRRGRTLAQAPVKR